MEKGFAYEEKVEKNGMPFNYFEYPAFSKYIREFYPNSIKCKISESGDNFMCDIIFENNKVISTKIPNFQKIFKRIDLRTNEITAIKPQQI